MKSLLNKGIEKGTTDVVSRMITSLWDNLRIKFKEIMIPTPEHFVQYTVDCYEKFSKVKCLARNQAVLDLNNIYVPLTLSRRGENNRSDHTYYADKFDISFFQKHNQFLIVDTAGMGKSTLVKKMFIDIIDNGLGIPIFIELRRLSKTHSLFQEFYDQISFAGTDINQEILYSFIKEGKFIFFLDGYDEIAFSEKKDVTISLQDFITHSRQNIFIMTSRDEQALSSFEGFAVYRINQLTEDESYSLLKKYDDDGEMSELLISKLKISNDYSEFLGNPLLTSMLLTAFSYKNEVPTQKHVFYRSVFDAYFNSHDLTKGGAYQHEKHSGLGIEEFHRVLRFIGIICLKKGKIEFSKDELIDTIEQAIKLCSDITCSAGDYFTDLLEVVPLFVQDGLFYRWAHKSIYEYFAAQNIYRDIPQKEKILKGLASEERIDDCYNLLDLYYEMDPSSFRRFILKDLFEGVVSFVESNAKQLTDNEIRRWQCFYNHSLYLIRVGRLTSMKRINIHLFHGRHRFMRRFPFGRIMYNCESIQVLFLYRLLRSKKHPAAMIFKATNTMSGNDLPRGTEYLLSRDDHYLLDDVNIGDTLLRIMESMGGIIRYDEAKNELSIIQREIKAVDSFTDDLFS